jgi:hypothetical protein
MDTGMFVILAAGAAIGGWAALAVMGAERARRLSQIEAQRPLIPPIATSPTPSNPAPAKNAAARHRQAPPDAATAKNAR